MSIPIFLGAASGADAAGLVIFQYHHETCEPNESDDSDGFRIMFWSIVVTADDNEYGRLSIC